MNSKIQMSDEPVRASENHWRYILGACFTAYNLGCGFGFTSPSLAEIQVLKDGDEENTIRELYASSINLGIILGTILCTTLLKGLAPRESLCASFIPTFIGWLCILISLNTDSMSTDSIDRSGDQSYTLELLFIARFILGVAGGLSTMYCPSFLLKSDYASNLSCLFQTSLVFGIFTQQLFHRYLPLNVIATINILNSFGVLFGLYEFKTFEDTENTSTTYYSQADAEIYSELLEMDSSDDSNSESFENTPWWFPFIVSASQQLCGLNAINFYLQQIFQTPEQASGLGLFSWLDSNSYAIIITFVQVLITASAGYLLYHRGLSNKSNMLTSCCIVFISLAAISGLMFLKINKFYLMFPTLLFQIGFSFGLGPTTWTIIAGSVNRKHVDQTRYTGQTVAINSLASFIVVFSFYPLVHMFSMAGLFSVYAIFTFCYFVFILSIY